MIDCTNNGEHKKNGKQYMKGIESVCSPIRLKLLFRLDRFAKRYAQKGILFPDTV